MWVYLKDIMLSEISQAQKDKYCIFLHMEAKKFDDMGVEWKDNRDWEGWVEGRRRVERSRLKGINTQIDRRNKSSV